MSLGKSLPVQCVKRPGRIPLWLMIGFYVAQPLTSLAAEGQLQSQWQCRPDGEQWRCSETESSSPVYERPAHSSSVARTRPRTAVKVGPGSAAAMDWVNAELLSPEKRREVEQACCSGIYRSPVRKDADATRDPEVSATRITADSTEWKQETTLVMSGDVRFTKGFRQLRADQASANQVTSNVNLKGNIQLREPGLLLTGESADLNIESGAAQIENASYLLHATAIRGDADVIARGGDGSMFMRDASLTRCEPGADTWLLKGSEIEINPATNKGTARHVRMSIGGIPLLYSPYLSFSTSQARKSGVLFPSLSNTDDGGLDLTVPYYFNLAPNYDLTLSPRLIQDRGGMLELEARHLSEQFKTIVSGAYLFDDDGGSDEDLADLVDEGVITREEAYPYEGEDRWLFSVQQRGGLKSRWYTSIDYTAISDNDYFRDMDTASLEVNSSTHVKKSGVLGYRSGNWTYSLRADEYEAITSVATTPYKQLPRINFDGRYRVAKNWELELDNEYVNFDHRDADSDELLTGERARLDYWLTYNRDWIWGFFKPAVGYSSLHYRLEDDYLKSGSNDKPSFNAGQASLDMGLYFERNGSLFGGNYLQTLEPRLFYFYSDAENQDELISVALDDSSVDFDTSELTFSYSQLFRRNSFSGGDRIEDANRVSVGIGTRFLDPDSGRELFSASLGQIIYLEDRTIDLLLTEEEMLASDDGNSDNSEYAARLSAELGNTWRWQADLSWDPDDSDRVSRGNTSLRYRDDQFRAFNISYRYVRRDPVVDSFDLDNDGDSTDPLEQTIDQGDISFALPLWGHWSLVGRHNHDFTHKRELESLFGVEYNNCCYLTRIVARQWLDNELIDVVASLDLEKDQGLFFEFHFKSLGGIGSKVADMLADSISGYRERN